MKITAKLLLISLIILITELSYAGNGDLIVNGKLGIGVPTPTAKLSLAGEGTGQILFGPAGFSLNYSAISLNGTLSTTNYNLTSSPTDQNLYINRPTGKDILFRENNASPTGLVVIKSGGNVGIGTSTGTGGTSSLIFGNGTKPTTYSGYAGFYAMQDPGFNFTQMHVFDGYGHETLISPHANDAPEFLYDPEDNMPMIVKEVQYFLGYVRYTNQTRAARLSGMTDAEKSLLSKDQRVCVIKETFAEYEARTAEKLTQLSWEEEQGRIKQELDANRQALVDAKSIIAAKIDAKTLEISSANDNAKLALQQDLTSLKQQHSSLKIPEAYTIQPMPTRLQAVLGK